MKSVTMGTGKGVKVEKDPRNDPDFRQEFTCTQGWNISSGDWTDGDGKSLQEVWKTGAVGGYGAFLSTNPAFGTYLILFNTPLKIHQKSLQ
jgi:hypothetical protein